MWEIKPLRLLENLDSPGPNEYRIWAALCAIGVREHSSVLQVTEEQLRKETAMDEDTVLQVFAAWEKQGRARKVSGI